MKPEDIIRISKRIAQTMYTTYFKKIREAYESYDVRPKDSNKDLAGVLEEAFENALVKAVSEALNSGV